MGEIHHGVPKEIALKLKERRGLSTFVETGTFRGDSALWAAKHFEQVITIEAHGNFYDGCVRRFENSTNIRCIWADSALALVDVVKLLEKPALFFLDAHWGDDLSYPAGKLSIICPVLREVAVINTSKVRHVIIVDDARLFGFRDGWPKFASVKAALENERTRRVMQIEDVLIALPRRERWV